jgi:hypothetical protein
MQQDLLAAQASVDWAKAQFPSFRKRTHAWLSEHVKTAIRDPDPNVPNNVIVAFTEEPLPLALSIEAGIYNFPVAVSEKVFASGGYKGVEFVKGLPSAQSTLIENVKPYHGGNSLLWALHRLDILRKHKRLIEVAIWPGAMSVSGWGLSGKFHPVSDFVSVNDETIIGLLTKGTQANVQVTPEIAINETNLLPRQAFIVALHDFAKLATEIVALFDTP